ncbi:MAG TPA: bifunctional 4-hydroxy-2-oxoglutarate aldolase/2-dehydro-3-deoxy-phosphogluconate aldolase [Steroidobacteraceae bacterium]|nr:bifunctional 4-hydroxy-2-oxoglutarate aldolase/2-dehydro-3-deoxy-phosphogluconate aldolase [Steroidobacteraceae bacterium]
MNRTPLAQLQALLGRTPVIPVLTIERAADAVPLATALLAGGLRVLEVTLRTEAALEALAEIATRVPEAVVGMGSVIEEAQFAAATRRGARFVVSPGATEGLEAAAAAAGVPWIPGVQSVSEALELRSRAYRFLKLFPAAAAGGVEFLRAIAGPLPDVWFCPTGGVSAANARDYLELANVACVGGSWLAPPELIVRQDWNRIRELAREARALRP